MTLNGAADVAKEAVKGLSGSPALLFLIILNIVMLGSMIYVAKNGREERRELRAQEDAITKLLAEQCARRS